jgi:hypothetical protein
LFLCFFVSLFLCLFVVAVAAAVSLGLRISDSYDVVLLL